MRALIFSLLVISTAATPAQASDVCSCGAADDIDWLSVSETSGDAFTCKGGDRFPDANDHFQIGSGCRVEVHGDILQADGNAGTGIEVSPGGVLEVRASEDGRRVLALGARGLECFGSCRLEGVFRAPDGGIPGVEPVSWPIEALDLCDADCLAAPEQACFAVPESALPGLATVVTGSDLETGTQDWACLWDFDKTDYRASYDDNACYPVVAVDLLEREVCVDVRQGRDSEYPHRLRRVQALRVAADILPGDGCGVVLDPSDDTRAQSCDASVLRLEALPGRADPIQADDELIGRFVRFEDPNGDPLAASYKILQTLDCSAAPAAPHACNGNTADIVTLGSLQGVAEHHDAGENAWIDYGWRAGDAFFLLSPVQVQSATAANDDSGALFEGSLHAQGVHFTNLGGGTLSSQSSVVVRLGAADVSRWRHIIIRNDTGDFAPNNGVDLNPDGLHGAVLGHTNILSNTGHAVLIGTDDGDTRDLVLEDFSIRHHQDGCFNHSNAVAEPEVEVRRSWCAFVQSDAKSAQWFAWQMGNGNSTRIEDSACDACDGGTQGVTIRSNLEDGDGFSVKRSLLWSPVGVLPSGDNEFENILFVGLRGDQEIAAPLLGDVFHNSVARSLTIRSNRAALQGKLDVRGALLRDILVKRDSVGAVVASDHSRVEGSAFLAFDSANPECAGGDVNCVVLQEGAKDAEGVEWLDIVVAWPPSTTTRLFGALRFRAQSADDTPDYHGVAIANHDFAAGTGTAFRGLAASTVGLPDWDDGPCFSGNERDVVNSAQAGLPPETSQGVPLGFVDPALYRFDTPVGSLAEQIQCGTDPAAPPGQRGYHYIHARTGLVPELMADDLDADGWPDDVPGPSCLGDEPSDCRDNCPAVFNPSQADVDLDGLGDACDAKCSDGMDNDLDGFVDYPSDPGCSSDGDASESADCGLGFEAALALLLLNRLGRGRRSAARVPAA